MTDAQTQTPCSKASIRSSNQSNIKNQFEKCNIDEVDLDQEKDNEQRLELEAKIKGEIKEKLGKMMRLKVDKKQLKKQRDVSSPSQTLTYQRAQYLKNIKLFEKVMDNADKIDEI